MLNKFVVTVPCYNCVSWVVSCLDSIYNQTYSNYEAVIVNDGSSDRTGELIQEWLSIKNDTRFKLINNNNNLGSAIGSIIKATDSMQINGNDIIVNVDGDDWLPDNDVFDYLNSVYNSDNILMTYGQFAPVSKTYSNVCAKVPDTATYRKSQIWLTKMYASHLRTYKKKVFDLINRDDFVDLYDPNKYMQYAGDMALLFPLLEICGNERAVFIDRVMYIYNDQNSISEMYKNPSLQIHYAKTISNRDVYEQGGNL